MPSLKKGWRKYALTADPFYSHENLSHLKCSFDELKENSGIEHDLLEADQ